MLPDHVRHQRFADGAFPRRLERGANGIIYRKGGGVEIADLETNAARVGTRPSSATWRCTNRHRKKPFVSSMPNTSFAGTKLVGKASIRELRIALGWH